MVSQRVTNWQHIAIEALIIAFVIWHMTAIAISSIPTDAKDPIAPVIRSYGSPIMHPYLMLTSQWQLWNIFSPDPLRQVAEYDIEWKSGGDWLALRTLNDRTVPPHRRADTFKILGRIEERSELWPRYLELQCEKMALPRLTPIRIVKRSYILPHDDAASIAGGWNGWEPEWHNDILHESICP